MDQFTSVYGSQSKCNAQRLGYATCEYSVRQGNQDKYHVVMSISGNVLQIYLRGDPRLAAKSVSTASTAVPTQQKAAKSSRYSITFKNNEVYINGMKLGMPEHAVKEELSKLNYKYNNKGAHELKAGNEKDGIQAFLLRHQLHRIAINEYDIPEQTKDEILRSIQATFGSKVNCKVMANVHSHIAASCNSVLKSDGKRTSFTAS